VSVVCVSAAAGSQRLPTKITIKDKGLTFSGKVSALDPSCIVGRKVTLHRTNGNRLGSYVTHPSGKWKITASGSAGISLGHFYATVAQKKVGTLLVCAAAKSKTIPFHQ
jgi:hypothetical protein